MNKQIEPEVGDILLHVEGDYYKVITHAKHSETSENMVVCSRLNTGGVWAIPISRFTNKYFKIVITAKQLSGDQDTWYGL